MTAASGNFTNLDWKKRSLCLPHKGSRPCAVPSSEDLPASGPRWLSLSLGKKWLSPQRTGALDGHWTADQNETFQETEQNEIHPTHSAKVFCTRLHMLTPCLGRGWAQSAETRKGTLVPVSNNNSMRSVFPGNPSRARSQKQRAGPTERTALVTHSTITPFVSGAK